VAAASRAATIQAYYIITKPGIIYGNCISAAAGYLLAAGRHVNWLGLLAALAGTALVIGAGCVLNNYIDREIDGKMERTKNRPLISGAISPRSALIYAAVLSLAGLAVLSLWTNTLTVYVGLLGLYFYVVLYGIWKRRSPIGTLVGSVSGSTPIVAGYTAASGHLDVAAALLFVIMALWQMPHFYAIAMYRLRDYQAAGLPVLPAVKGNRRTQRRLMQYIVAFTLACCGLTLSGHAGISFAVAMVAVGSVWFWKGTMGYNAKDKDGWARRMFGFSLLAMLSLSFFLAINSLLP
jgi:protoheme IX farnesyltransferase